MYYELYLDVLFLENFLMDYILLLVTKRVLHIRSPVWRLCLAAIVGAFSTCAVIAIGIPCTSVKLGLFYGIIPGIMLISGMRIRSVSEFARGLLTLYISGFLVGGIFTFLGQYAQVGSIFFALAVGSYYLSVGVLKILAMFFHFGETHSRAYLVYGDKNCWCEALIDTGNHLTDPVSGKAVSIVSQRVAEQLLDWDEITGLRQIAYHTIGKGRGQLPVLMIDSLKLEGDDQAYESPMIALSEDTSFGNAYDMILNPDI